MRASGRPLALVRAGRARETLHLAKSFGILHYVRTRTALRKRGSLTRSTDVWSVVQSEEAPSVVCTAAYISTDRCCRTLRNDHISKLATQLLSSESTRKRAGLDGRRHGILKVTLFFSGDPPATCFHSSLFHSTFLLSVPASTQMVSHTESNTKVQIRVSRPSETVSRPEQLKDFH